MSLPKGSERAAAPHARRARAPREGALASGPVPFGDYLLLRRLGAGGMGEVFLAKSTGLKDIEKLLVVKTLREQHTQDKEYVRRFLDEARVVVQLSHRNICPVFDVGQVGSEYYLAMEHIHGRDLRTLLDALAAAGQRMPPALAVFLAGEVLEALDYAHRLVDPATGESLHLAPRASLLSRGALRSRQPHLRLRRRRTDGGRRRRRGHCGRRPHPARRRAGRRRRRLA